MNICYNVIYSCDAQLNFQHHYSSLQSHDSSEISLICWSAADVLYVWVCEVLLVRGGSAGRPGVWTDSSGRSSGWAVGGWSRSDDSFLCVWERWRCPAPSPSARNGTECSQRPPSACHTHTHTHNCDRLNSIHMTWSQTTQSVLEE